MNGSFLRIKTAASDSTGAAAVEMGIVLPLLVLLVFGIIDFGRMFNAQITLQHAAREGARILAITKDATLATTVTTAAASSIALNSVATTACVHGSPTSVTATHDFIFSIPLISADQTLSATGTMRCGG